jgi:glyoxylase-like metal-dependent hydrolase (beta-lactamase superfamily II)
MKHSIPRNSHAPTVHPIFDPASWTVTYIVHAGKGSDCAVIDSVLDYDHKSGRTSTTSADQVIDYIKTNQLKLAWILETHAHADHLSAAAYLKLNLGGKTAIGEKIQEVQEVFKAIFNLEPEFEVNGSQFDRLLKDDESLSLGDLSVKVLSLPGHTPACVGYQIGDAVFVGDTLFMPDVGTARCDFPGGDARNLFNSIKRILSLAPQTRLFMCHDYPPNNRPIAFETTVALQKSHNIHVNDNVTEMQFIEMRTQRDSTLDMPTLILPSVQFNIRAGEMPPKESNGVSYLKIPMNKL